MPIRIGSTAPETLYIGTTRIFKAYLGANLLFDVSYIATQASNVITAQNDDELITQNTSTY